MTLNDRYDSCGRVSCQVLRLGGTAKKETPTLRVREKEKKGKSTSRENPLDENGRSQPAGDCSQRTLKLGRTVQRA